MMRILITGGAGFIGSAMARHLILKTPDQVLVVDKLTYAGNLSSLESIANEPRFDFAKEDICNSKRMSELVSGFSPDIILHLAAESHVDRSIDDPGSFIQTNIVGTCVMLEVALSHWRALPATRQASFRFHHVSTDEVFGSLAATGLFDENSAYDPKSPYSASKASADHLVRAWHTTYGLPVVITNCSNNYGPYHFPEKLIPLTIINGIEGKPLPVYGAGANVRDWLYVDDHVEALMLVAQQGIAGQTYCIGGSSERSNIEVVRQVCAYLDEFAPDPAIGRRESLIQFVEDRAGHDFRYAIDSGKLEQELGWKPRKSFETGLRATVQWYLANRAWWQPIRSRIYTGNRLGLQRTAQSHSKDSQLI